VRLQGIEKGQVSSKPRTGQFLMDYISLSLCVCWLSNGAYGCLCSAIYIYIYVYICVCVWVTLRKKSSLSSSRGKHAYTPDTQHIEKTRKVIHTTKGPCNPFKNYAQVYLYVMLHL
jgi:hypothetical protein